MWRRAISSSTTSSKRASRGQPKADRRLARELADKQLLRELIGAARGISSSFANTAISNPVVGLVTGIIALDVLYRVRVLSPIGYFAGLGAVGVIEGAAALTAIETGIGAVISGIGNIIPSIGAKASPASQENLIGTANTPTYAAGRDGSEAMIARRSGSYTPE